MNWDLREVIEIEEENFMLNENQNKQIVSDFIRAIIETIIDSLVKIYSNHIAQHHRFYNPNNVNILVSMTKK